MTAVHSESERYMECGRIYLNQDNRYMFIIKCYYCCADFNVWSNFLEHLELSHQDLEQSYSTAQLLWMETYQELSMSPQKSPTQPSQLCNDYHIDCLSNESRSDANFFVVGKYEDDNELEELTEEVEEELANLGQFTSIDTINKAMSFDETVQTATDSSKISNEYMTGEFDIKSQSELEADNSEEPIDEISLKNSSSLQTAVNLPKNEKEKKPRRNRRWPETHERSFYHMTRTDPKIMHQFIELLKIHECQWKTDHPEYDDIPKRNQSAEEIGQVLQNRWNLPPISAQSARNSILQIRRWFELEYVEYMRNPNYKSKHIDYYQRLIEFLPYKHLRPLVCDECDRRFRTETCLVQHKHRVHNAPQPHECKFCGRIYPHKSLLELHENRHTRNKSWLCQHCGYNAPNKSDYRVHLVSHTDKRAYVCNICGLSYKSSTSLAVHRRTHAPPTLTCQYCDKMFYENYRLKQHIRTKHSNDKHTSVPVKKTKKHLNIETPTAYNKEDDKLFEKQDQDFNDSELEVLLAKCAEVRFDCSHCGEDFASEEDLHVHTQVEH